MTATQLRELLFTYSMSHEKADDLIAEIEHIVHTRRDALIDLLAQPGLGERIAYGARRAEEARRRLSADRGSPFAAIRKGIIKTLFTSEDADEDKSKLAEFEGIDASDLELADGALQEMVDVGRYISVLNSSCRSSFGKATREIEEGTMFELGRCIELIAGYRRIDFESGQRKTRLDQELRRNMSKRVLSRMLP
jgi:hypothetical protein